eukprot:6368711-Amphidinium_carterae.1
MVVRRCQAVEVPVLLVAQYRRCSGEELSSRCNGCLFVAVKSLKCGCGLEIALLCCTGTG